MTEAVLTLTDVACARGGQRILDHVSFALGRGEVIVLRGPNGAGKTTLLRTIAGLQRPLSGRIEVEAEDLIYASHADGLKGTLTVAENLTFWARLFGGGAIDHALETMELTKLSGNFAQNLSAGQKRRLGLARLLVTGRDIWILDEPTVSLDQASVAIFSDVVAEHVAVGGSVLATTHIDFMPDARTIDVSEFKPDTPFVADTEEAYF